MTCKKRIDNMDSIVLAIKSLTLSTKSETQNRFQVQHDDFGEDIISELPDELLLHILSFLPTKDIVSTSALSTRWLYLWTFFTIVSFNFDAYKEKKKTTSFLDSVKRELLMIPDTARIQKFRLHSTFAVSSSQILASMSIVSKIVKHKVEELDLSIPYMESNLFSLPHSLCTSESLTSLTLHMTQAALNSFPASISFPRLKYLNLDGIEFQDEYSAQLLLSSCPVLEELYLDNCDWTKRTEIKISIPTLLTLSISLEYNGPPDISIRICAPNLLNFSYTSFSLVELVTCDLSSVIRAEVDVFGWLTYDQRVQVGHRTLKLLEGIRGVKYLELSNRTLEVISFAENFQAVHLPTFYNLTHLTVSFVLSTRGGATLMHVLQKSPSLYSLHFFQGFDLDILGEENHLLDNLVPISFKNLKNVKDVPFLNIYSRMIKLWSRFQTIAQMIYQKTWKRKE
ncbi:F-box/LRR-repeat protein At4g14103-like [Herrania umbratica]|uniref:F-box/LRR-repeat protein At4g14103-like n=1 Tax=Herrania umbratica TaxID=108875 RepID=A0A6J1AJL7_9ROSI|nr:F-box/LRR-repeat protein At4g14103-like [Herrania umbratica]